MITTSQPNVLAVATALPARSVAELIDYAKIEAKVAMLNNGLRSGSTSPEWPTTH